MEPPSLSQYLIPTLHLWQTAWCLPYHWSPIYPHISPIEWHLHFGRQYVDHFGRHLCRSDAGKLLHQIYVSGSAVWHHPTTGCQPYYRTSVDQQHFIFVFRKKRFNLEKESIRAGICDGVIEHNNVWHRYIHWATRDKPRIGTLPFWTSNSRTIKSTSIYVVWIALQSESGIRSNVIFLLANKLH